MENTVFYLPGFGGQLHTGLGVGLMDRGFRIAGRETRGDFKQLSFQQQIDTVASDLQEHFWREDAIVVANSFGGYLFLHAQLQLPPYVGRLLLLSPIVGDFQNDEIRMGFVPPRAEVLLDAAQGGRFPRPLQAEIHVGSEDWQSNPTNVTTFGNAIGVNVQVVPGGGHMLGKDYVGQVLDRWLPTQ